MTCRSWQKAKPKRRCTQGCKQPLTSQSPHCSLGSHTLRRTVSRPSHVGPKTVEENSLFCLPRPGYARGLAGWGQNWGGGSGGHAQRAHGEHRMVVQEAVHGPVDPVVDPVLVAPLAAAAARAQPKHRGPPACTETPQRTAPAPQSPAAPGTASAGSAPPGPPTQQPQPPGSTRPLPRPRQR